MALANTECLGVGLGLRPPHLYQILREKPAVPWFEVHICNYLQGGINRKLLRDIREHYPLSFHGVSLNLGGIDPIDTDYLQRLRETEQELQPGLISEHACFTAHQGQHFHDLLPVPFTTAAIDHFVSRVNEVQDYLQRPIALENLSRYQVHDQSEFGEAEFLVEIAHRSGCKLLLDLNNLYVNQQNLQESVADFLAAIPSNKISEIHLAGHSVIDGKFIDTHGNKICEDVWDIYRKFIQNHPNVPTLIEWDSNLPAFDVLMAEKHRAEGQLAA